MKIILLLILLNWTPCTPQKFNLNLNPIDMLSTSVKSLSDGLVKDVGTVSGAISKGATALTSGVKTAAGGIGKSLTSGATDIIHGVAGASTQLLKGDFMGALQQGTGAVMKGIEGTVRNGAESVMNGAMEASNGLVMTAGEVAGTVVNRAAETIQAPISMAGDQIKSASMDAIGMVIGKSINTVVRSLKDGNSNEIMKAIRPLLKTVEPFLPMLKQFLPMLLPLGGILLPVAAVAGGFLLIKLFFHH